MTRAAMLLAGAVVVSGCDDAPDDGPTADIYGGPPVVEPEPASPEGDEDEGEAEGEADLADEPVPPVPAYGAPSAPPEE